MLISDWWDEHPFRVSTVTQTGYASLYLRISQLLADLPNEENE